MSQEKIISVPRRSRPSAPNGEPVAHSPLIALRAEDVAICHVLSQYDMGLVGFDRKFALYCLRSRLRAFSPDAHSNRTPTCVAIVLARSLASGSSPQLSRPAATKPA